VSRINRPGEVSRAAAEHHPVAGLDSAGDPLDQAELPQILKFHALPARTPVRERVGVLRTGAVPCGGWSVRWGGDGGG